MLLEAKSGSEKLGGLVGVVGEQWGSRAQLGDGMGAQDGSGPGQYPALCPGRVLLQLS